MSDIDLRPFCSVDPNRSYLHNPWSRGEFSYATNGHLLVRVARRDDVADFDKAPDCERVLSRINFKREFIPVPHCDFPAATYTACTICDGRGYEHECPDCACACDDCNGTGQVSSDQDASIQIDEIFLALRYARIVFPLPGAQLPEKLSDKFEPVPFRFDGGIGAWSPCRLRAINMVVR